MEHLRGQHTKSKEVFEALQKSGKERELAFEKVKNLGNFKHNSTVLSTGNGELIVVRRPKTDVVTYQDYVPCTICYGFFKCNELWRHNKICKHRKEDACGFSEPFSLTKARMLLAGSFQTNLKFLHTSVLSLMRHDDVYAAILKDGLILQFGDILLNKLGIRRKNDIAQRMRQLGKLIELLHNDNENNLELSDYLIPSRFDAVVNAVRKISGYKMNKEDIFVFETPSLAIRLGHHIIKCAEIKRGRCIRDGSDIILKQTANFIDLYHIEWTDRMSSVALASLKTNKFNKEEALPLTEDLVLLKTFLVKNINLLNSSISKETPYAVYRSLLEYTLVRIILFNERRSSEVAMLLLDTVKQKIKWGKTAHQEILNCLQPQEKQLLKRLDMVQTQGKLNKRVPIVLTEDMQTALCNITKYREYAGDTTNKYVFSSGEKGFLNAWQVINKCAKLAGCQQPNLISSSRLRKYIATACQVVQRSALFF